MAIAPGKHLNQIRRRVRTALVGPQLAAFIPALTLGAYWYGGEGLLLFIALVFPALIALTGILTRTTPGTAKAGDGVTGLPLRDQAVRAFDAAIGMTDGITDQVDQVCLTLEVDDVESIRTRYGHAAADRLFSQVGERLRSRLRDSDLLASLGTGRFAVIVRKTPQVDLEVMIQMAARLQSVISEPLSLDQTRVLVTCCVGFCLPSRAPDLTGEAFISAAESALEQAKHAGPGSVRAYSPEMPLRKTGTSQKGKEVVKALEDGQVIPWFQPQISTDTGELSGFEALARWVHPEQGLIAPGAFLPAIARAGMFERLGEVILFKALTALREWDRTGLEVPHVSVNLSGDELRNPKLFDKIRWELDRFELAPDRLVFEVLEDVVAQSEDDITTLNIAALAKLGCGIDLDDFGTGSASIANIRRFDVQRIKIDRAFITHVDTDREQQDMVAAMLTMAERLRVDTVAEGVETVGEHSMLAQLGCGHVQGYSIAKPMPFEETGAWITQHRAKLALAPSLKRQA